jgi:hypothetical protein
MLELPQQTERYQILYKSIIISFQKGQDIINSDIVFLILQ